MKKIGVFLIIVLLVIIAFFQYKNYQRYRIPNEVVVSVSNNIDTEYHDQLMVATYYEQVYKLESLVKSAWFTYGVDIRYADLTDYDSQRMVSRYNKLKAAITTLETKLEKSLLLKNKGVSNKEIKYIEQSGLSYEEFKEEVELQKLMSLTSVHIGDESEAVFKIQGFLIQKGYDIQKDGVYKEATNKALKKFQEENEIYPSGILNLKTIRLLVKKEDKNE